MHSYKPHLDYNHVYLNRVTNRKFFICATEDYYSRQSVQHF